MNEHLIPSFVAMENPSDIYLHGSFVALDFETDEEQNGSALVESNDVVLSCWSVYRDGKEVKRRDVFGGIYDISELLEDIAAVDFLLAFNAKFELQWLKRAGLELRDVLVFDPMLAQWVLDGNRKGKGFERSLRGMARRYGARPKLDLVGKLLDAGVPTRSINERWLKEYCYRDVDAMVDIFQKQKEVLEERQVWHLVHTRNLTCSVLADIEFAGLELDKDKVYKEYTRVKQRLQELENELAEITGGVKLSSPPQLAPYLYDTLKFAEVKDWRGKPIRTDKGAKSTAAPVIAKLEATTDKQKEFLSKYKEYNKMTSLLEKNLEYFKRVCDHQNGKFYGQIKQNVVKTHRLASSGLKTKFPISSKTDKKGNVKVKYKEMSVNCSAFAARAA